MGAFHEPAVAVSVSASGSSARPFSPAAGPTLYHAAKAFFERALALVLLIPALPLIVIFVVAIRLTSKGPGIYSQTRVGKDGRVFTMYKLRSMRCDAELRSGPVWAAIGQDPRVTPLGNWLRLLHLDELPQLYNIVRGEMALVGPRPERPAIVAVLAEKIPDYLERLQVLPGITGLAQINLPPDSDLDSVRAKLQLDREYILTAGVWLDLRIVLCTLLRLVGLRGGRGVWLLGLKRTVLLPASEDSSPVIPVVSQQPAVTTIEVPVGPDFEPSMVAGDG